MGRKNRRKPFQCPVPGCAKRGLRADLVRHASAVHPDVGRISYIAAMENNTMLPGTINHGYPPPRRTPGWVWLTILIAIAALGWFLLQYLTP